MPNAIYWRRVRRRAAELGSDGCTFVTEAFHDCCLEHDIFFRTGKDLDGNPVCRDEANARFRDCMRSKSKFGKWSPMAAWRWVGVHLFGRPSASCES